MTRRQELLLGATFLLGGVGLEFVLIPIEIPALQSQVGEVSPAFFPHILAWVLIVLGVLHVATHTLRHRATGGEEGVPGWRSLARAAGVLAITAAYVWLLPRLGFLLATMAALVVLILFLGPWRPLKAVIVGVPFAWGLELAFTHFLRVPLPRAGWLE